MIRSVRRSTRWFATSGSLLLLALFGACPAPALAGAIVTDGGGGDPARFTYETSGTIGMEGITGKPLIHFSPTSGSAPGSTDFALGSFFVSSSPSDPVTHYDHTPFQIRFSTPTIDGFSTVKPEGVNLSPLTVGGWITGDAGGNGRSILTIQFDQGIQPTDPKYFRQPHPLPPIPAGSALGGTSGMTSVGYLVLHDGAPSSPLDGQGMIESPILASVEFAPNVPEPSSILIGGGLAGAGLIARRRAIRRG